MLTDSFDRDFILATMMGPNAMRIAEELTARLPIRPGMKVLDLGCGRGLSSIVLAQKFQATVFAVDLWIEPTENAARFASLGLDERIIPLHIDVKDDLPFADEYFDLLISIDAWHYFGTDEHFLPKLLRHVKTGGRVAVAVPGLKNDFIDGRIPEELQPFWQPDMPFHSCRWWQNLWQKEPVIEIESCREMDCFRQAWDDWLQSPNPYAQNDIAMIEADGGRYFNLVEIVGKKTG